MSENGNGNGMREGFVYVDAARASDAYNALRDVQGVEPIARERGPNGVEMLRYRCSISLGSVRAVLDSVIGSDRRYVMRWVD